jgi:7-carboxy-7-deazaguanine synthase
VSEADEKRYPIAPNGIFWTIQGEGHLRGFQMGFIRLGGCSVGCPQCDTDYSVDRKMTPGEISVECFQKFPHDRDTWVWITGGEPADHDLRPLLNKMKLMGYSTAVATSGAKRVVPPVDWLSISPHSSDPAKFQQRYGNEIKIVDGLNGLNLDEWSSRWDREVDFMYRYVQPLARPDGTEDPESLQRCLAFLKKHPRWALSRQDHKYWGVA